jgi:pyruvate formate lyase activating enzyme
MKRCELCGKKSAEISERLQVCANCVREKGDEALRRALSTHKKIRMDYGLPPQPPKTLGGIRCKLCANECMMGQGERGYCGLRENDQGWLKAIVDPTKCLLHSYLDPHVTNCCAAWFCPAGTGIGYPDYAYSSECERGYYNYAVFFYGCNFNCIFCQNSSHKNFSEGKLTTVEEFVADVKAKPNCSCICYFGGSPEPQLAFAINASRTLLQESPDRILRICFEWNGCGNSELVRKAGELS